MTETLVSWNAIVLNLHEELLDKELLGEELLDEELLDEKLIAVLSFACQVEHAKFLAISRSDEKLGSGCWFSLASLLLGVF